MDTSSTQIEGRVAQVNAKGLKLEGADSWLNVSKFAEGVVMPAKGAQVVLTLDKAGFIRRIEAPAPVAVQPVPSVATVPQIAGAQGEAPDKDRLIVRQSCLKAAAEIAAGYPKAGAYLDAATVAGVALQLAEAFEAWVYREA